jgi:type III secretion protein L
VKSGVPRGRVIKADQAQSVRRHIVEAPLYDAKLQAERLLAEARAEAERRLADSERECERLRAQAVAEGRERGLAAVSELLVGARAAATRARRDAERELRVLAVRIAEKILGRQLDERPEAIADIVGEALRLAGEAREIVVRAHPDDLAALERGRPRLIERAKRASAVTFRADPQVRRGGCILETELGIVDARLSTQLDAIERSLKGDGD